MKYKKLKKRKWVALVLIILISLLINQCLIDKNFFHYLNLYVKDLSEIILIIFVMVIGIWGLKTLSAKWPNTIWKTIYYTSIIFFIVMSLVDNLIFNYSTRGQFRFFAIKQILWSPLVYLTIILISMQYEKQTNAH